MSLALQLCLTCREIPLQSFFAIEFPLENAIFLGPLQDIIQKQERCRLCAAVVASFQARQPWSKIDAERTLKSLQARRQSTDIWLYSYVFINDEQVGEKALRVGVSTLGPRKDGLNSRKHAGDLQVLGDLDGEVGKIARWRGRSLKRTADMGLARVWLNECLNSHGASCNHPGSGEEQTFVLEQPQQLRVIDVRERRLLDLPEEAEYVALSYCWPREPGLTNTKSSGIDLTMKGAIILSNGISRTIDDACNTVRELDEKYIWIDALCIKQDSPQDKSIQIGQMDLVYGNALLTIIASPDADDPLDIGLPGYREPATWRSQKIHPIGDDIHLVVPKPCLEDVLSFTRWDTRGWTFQETHLSRRSLHFTSPQLYFQCACGMRCEDTVGEGLSPAAVIATSTTLWNPKNSHAVDDVDDFGNLFLSRAPYENDTDALSAYDNFVTYYLRRELSFGSDILNAFQGVANILETAMDTVFYAGLPLKWLDHALLWQPYGRAERRGGFPTFSWAGWEEGADAPYWLLPWSTRVVVQWWYLEGNGWVRCETEGTEEERGGQEAALREVEVDVMALAVPSHAWGLAAVTEVASFHLSYESAEVSEAEIWPHGEHIWILDNSKHKVGLILIDKEWKAEHVADDSKHDFILLSGAQRSRIQDVPSFDEALYERREWSLFNVMLVVWTDGGLAGRVAVGTLHCDAWRAAGAVKKTVCLE